MTETEEIEAMLDMHRETLGMLARMALHSPDMVDQLIAVLQQSSVIFIPKAPDRQDEYQTLVGDVINLLARIKAGEVDPRDFLTTEESTDADLDKHQREEEQ